MNNGYKKWIEDNLSIVNKEGNLVPFKLNEIQDRYLTQDTSNGKDFILKGRQMGFSSLILAMFTADFLMKENVYNVVVADNTDNAQGLLKRVKDYINCIDPAIGKLLKYNSKYELYLESSNSTYKIGTAENINFGRSKTLTNLHLCVGETTKIITTNGFTKTIKDIQIGDEVIACDGKKTVVTNKWDTGTKKLLKIRLWLGNETIEVSPEHKVLVLGKKGWEGPLGMSYHKSDPVWKQAKDLTTKDYVVWAYPKTGAYVKHLVVKNIKNACHIEDKVKPVTRLDNIRCSGLVLKTDYKLGYFLGYYLAEGHITKNLNHLSFACHKDEEFYKEFVDLFPIKPKISVRSDSTGTRKIVEYDSKELATFVNDLVGRVENKHIPDKFLYNYPKEFLGGLYCGWRDGDGSKAQLKWKNISIITIRESIARQMKQIYALINHRLLALDYLPERYRYDKKTKPIYAIREYGLGKMKKNGVRSKNGKQTYLTTRNMPSTNGVLFARVKSIEEIGDGNTYEIEVAHPSHSYLTVAGVVSNSESCFYPHLSDMLAGALQALVPTGRAIIESTANGFNEGKELWDRSVLGESGFKPLFYNPHDFYPKEFLEEKKKELGDRLFMQEYPRTATEAFITSGQCFFDTESLRVYMDNAKEPMDEGVQYEL